MGKIINAKGGWGGWMGWVQTRNGVFNQSGTYRNFRAKQTAVKKKKKKNLLKDFGLYIGWLVSN